MTFGRVQPGVDLQTHAANVERILGGVGVDPAAARMQMQDGYGWSFRRGSALIEIYVSAREGVGYIQTLSPLLHVPATNLLPLYRYLLELNLQLTEAAMGIYLDTVYVFSERPLEGLDVNEANTLINLVAQYADDLDNRLVDEFGGRLYSRI